MDRRRSVNTCEQRTIKISRNVWPEPGYVAAQIGNGLDPQAEKLAVLYQARAQPRYRVRARRKTILRCANTPISPSASLWSGPGYDCFFRVVKLIHSEAA